MIISVQFHKALPDKTICFKGKAYDFITDSDVKVGDIVRMYEGNRPIFSATRVKIVKTSYFSKKAKIKVNCIREV